MRITIPLTVLAALVAIVSVSLGGHIYRWEAIGWMSLTALWAVIALIYERLASK